MTAIEEMYKAYRVGGIINCRKGIDYGNICNKDCSCTQCEDSYYKYPPFTAEKQLELIKYILTATTTDELRIYYSEILKCYVFHWYSIPELDMRDSCTTQNAEYELALAELVTMLKNELNHAKVKEILEG